MQYDLPKGYQVRIYETLTAKLFFLLLFLLASVSLALWLTAVNTASELSLATSHSRAETRFQAAEKNLLSLQKRLRQEGENVAKDLGLVLDMALLHSYKASDKGARLPAGHSQKVLRQLQKYGLGDRGDTLALYGASGNLVAFTTADTSGYAPTQTAPVPLRLNNPDPGITFSATPNPQMEHITPLKVEGTPVGYFRQSSALSPLLRQDANSESCLVLQTPQQRFLLTQSCNPALPDTLFNGFDTSDAKIQSLKREHYFLHRYDPPFPFILFLADPKEAYDGIMASMHKQTAVIVILFLLLAAAAVSLFAKNILLAPLASLSAAMGRLSRGEYEDCEIQSKDELGTLTHALNKATHSIERREHATTRNYEEVILAMVDIIEQRDTYTAGHSRRVAEYCERIARSMGMGQETVQKLYKAALLHDIGKIQTPDSVLLKPGKLNALEERLLQQHVSASDAILSKLTIYKELANIVKYHHECYDGSGYPFGLKGENIPLLSRIMSVADAFDAMTTNRVYKPRLNIEQALKQLQRHAGTQFDPEVVAHAKEALKDVILQTQIATLPATDIDKERFAYFFKDNLTGVYNLDYLRMLLNKNIYKDSPAYALMLKNFSSYNERHGWEAGNRFLREFAQSLRSLYPRAPLFRIEGDDFIVIADGVDAKALQAMQKERVTIEIKRVDLEKVVAFQTLKSAL